MRVSGAAFGKPRSSSVVAKASSRLSPGCSAGSRCVAPHRPGRVGRAPGLRQRGPRQVQTIDAQPLGPLQEQLFDRHAAAVEQGVAAGGHGARLARVELHVQGHGRDARQRQALQWQQGLLGGGQQRVARRRRLVVVQPVGVVQDPGAAAHPGQGRRAGHDTGRPAQAARSDAPTGPPGYRRATPPQGEGGHHEQQAKGRPVGLEPGRANPEAAGAVHVRQWHRRAAGKAVQVVLETGGAKRHAGHQLQQHQRPAQGLVRRQHLHEHRQHGQLQRRHQRRQPEPGQVVQRLQGRPALGQLHRHAGEHGHRAGGREHERDGRDLGQQMHPVGRRSGVDNLVQPAFTVAPDQLAAVVDRDDDRHDVEGALQRLHHQPCRRPGAGAVPLAGEPGRRAAIDHADRQQHEEGRAAQDEGHVVARQHAQLRPAAAGARGRQRAGRRCRRRSLAGGRGARAGSAGLGEAEAPPGQRQQRSGNAQPEQPVGEQQAVQRRHQGVALGRRPVARDDAQRRDAEGVDQGRPGVETCVAQQAAGDEEGHHQGHRGDIAPHHRTCRGGQREEDRGDDEHRRQRDDEERVGVMRRHEGADLVGVEPGHRRADGDGQRHAGQHQEGGRGAADETPAEVGRLAQPRAAHQGREAGLVVADHAAGDQGDLHENREQAHDAQDLQDRERRVQVDVAARADLDLVDRDRAEGEPEENRAADPEHRAAQLLAQLEGGDVADHAAACAAAVARRT